MFLLLTIASTLFLVSRGRAQKVEAVSHAVNNDAAQLGTMPDLAAHLQALIAGQLPAASQPVESSGGVAPAPGSTLEAGQLFGPVVEVTPEEVLGQQTPPILVDPSTMLTPVSEL
jgi:hypothetical protein